MLGHVCGVWGDEGDLSGGGDLLSSGGGGVLNGDGGVLNGGGGVLEKVEEEVLLGLLKVVGIILVSCLMRVF